MDPMVIKLLQQYMSSLGTQPGQPGQQPPMPGQMPAAGAGMGVGPVAPMPGKGMLDPKVLGQMAWMGGDNFAQQLMSGAAPQPGLGALLKGGM